jgi:stress response protein YsnF
MDDQETRRPEALRSAGTVIVPLYTEEISVSTRKLATGRIRVSTRTREHEEVVDQVLTNEHVTVEHVPVGKVVTEMPQMRRDGETLIVPIVDEVLVVQRQLILKEEVRIRRERKTEKHQERVKVRKQEAVITRLPADEQETQTGSVTGVDPKLGMEEQT